MTPTSCDLRANSSAAAASARPGNVVCFDDAPGERLRITKGGTPESPITYSGTGHTAVKGITVEADNVVVQGFTANQPQAPGIELRGNNITAQDNTVIRPMGGDRDGLRFFGNTLKILHNSISETTNEQAHGDCMQTFNTTTPPSRGVEIAWNKCLNINNMCLMAEGVGQTSDFTVANNVCETAACDHAGCESYRLPAQALMFKNVQNVTVTNNAFTSKTPGELALRAINLADHSTGAKVSGNTVPPGMRLVSVDGSSRPGYQGP